MLFNPNTTTAKVAEAGTVVTGAAVVSASMLQMIFVGSLAQVWGMVNGLQIIVHCPSYTLEIPPTVLELIK